MYESFFGLRQRPFPSAPLANRYVPVAGLEHARRTLSRCIERAEGPALVVGPAGTGKTLLCHLLAEAFPQQFQPVLLAGGHLAARRDLLQAILFELGLPYRGLEEGELRLTLIDHLTRSPQCRQGMLLLVDEADMLPIRLLDELRTITNIVRGGEPRARLVLVGGPALEERLASPKLESFSQRLAARCYLESLGREETCEYVRAQIRQVGGEPSHIFHAGALEAVHQASDGIPRLINQICDHALLLAAQSHRRPVDAAMIETAWANLQQLPVPWPETALERARSQETAVEFGALEDEGSMDLELEIAPRGSETSPLPHFEISLGQQPETCPEVPAAAHEFPLAEAARHLDNWDAGAPEVEIDFEDTASEPSEMFEINLSLTGPSHDTARPQWHSTEFCELPCEAGWEQYQPPSALSCEGDIVSDREMSEEVVFDRYATLDALKKQGRLSHCAATDAAAQPNFAAPAPHPLSSAAAAEKSLTLAEALVQHATNLEQAGWTQPPEELLSSEVANGGFADAWSSFDLLPPLGEETPLPSEQPLDGLTVHLDPTENSPSDESAEACLPLTFPAADREDEPALIVVEDETPGVQLQIPPQAMPVKKQEYRQLFARLRRS